MASFIQLNKDTKRKRNFTYLFDNVENLSKEEPFGLTSKLTPPTKISCRVIHGHSPLTAKQFILMPRSHKEKEKIIIIIIINK